MNEFSGTRIIGLVFVGLITLFFLVGGVWGCNAGMAKYNVWEQGKEGEAELARADSNRKIKTLEAQAAKESARFQADAEIIRAEGVAKANLIIGDSLKGNEAYLRYLWIDGLRETTNQIVYVPTEANLPILEAGKR